MNPRRPAPGSLVATVGEAMAIAFAQIPQPERHDVGADMAAADPHYVDGELHCAGFLRSAAAAAGHYNEDHAARTLGVHAAYAALDGEAVHLLDELPAGPPWDVVRAGLAALLRAGPESIRAALADVEDPRRVAIMADDSTEVVGYT